MAKYVLIGVFATLVDLGILNLLILISGIALGWQYRVFKGISFIFATCSKYVGDKFWAFEQMNKEEMKKEFTKFFLITLIGLVINIGIASFVVNFLGYHIITLFGSNLGLSEKMIANLGGIAAAVGAALWNFVGYKFIVFKK
jgi:putative flippase GtrA